MRALFLTVAAVAAVVGLAPAQVWAAAAQWNVARIGGPEPGRGAVIAVVDTGVDASHPAFRGRVLPQVNVAGSDGDGHGHGTHVAGTAAGGSLDCGSGSTAIGVAPGASILPVRVLDDDGRGTLDDVASGIRLSADRGADVINLSLGPELGLLGGGDTSAIRDALEYAWEQGSIPVLAAGNDGDNLLRLLFPAGYGDVPAVLVTATTHTDAGASYADSVGGARWGLAAPGGDGSGKMGRDILSAWPDEQCALIAGTSMAAPHVSGALAVLRAKGVAPQQAVDRILATARPLSPRSHFGAGLLDLAAAVAGLSTTPEPGPTGPLTPPTTIDARPAPTISSPAPAQSSSQSTTEPSPGPVEESTKGPGSSERSSTTAAAPAIPSGTEAASEGAVGAGELAMEDDAGSVGLAGAAAGVACATAWVLLGTAALRLRSGQP